MNIKAKIKFNYKTNEQAKTVFRALNPDNRGYVTSDVRSNTLICNLSSDNVGSFLATADDLIFCEILAEKIREISEGGVR